MHAGGTMHVQKIAVPGMGILGPGNVPWPALMAGPYVPRCRLRKCLWVSGVPTCNNGSL